MARQIKSFIVTSGIPSPSPPPPTGSPPPTSSPTPSPPPSILNPLPPTNPPAGCTNITTGVANRDQHDAAILRQCSAWNWTWPLIIKALIFQESSFNTFAISSDTPCGIEPGWTSLESRSFGISQITPACSPQSYDTPPFNFLLSNGHPNMTQDTNSSLWPTSVFNPDANLSWMCKEMRKHYTNYQQEFPGCTVKQYIKMALVAHNAGPDDVFGCNSYSSKGNTYIANVKERYDDMAMQIGCSDRL